MQCIHKSYDPETCKVCIRNKQFIPVKCQICGKEIEKKSHQSMARYALRVACSDEHSKEWIKLNGKGWFI